MKIKILTWNVNSIRARIKHIEKIERKVNPDVICLQETKVNNESFPREKIYEIGYKHIYLNGIKSYNGVCIISKIKADNHNTINWCKKNDGRHIKVNIKGFSIHSLYVPAGGEVPDENENPKFKHKIDFLKELTIWSKTQSKREKTIICGDLNIAPHVDDVWSHEALKNVVSHTTIEREKLLEIQKLGNWCDITREILNNNENLFTWWSYRSPDYKKYNRGRRLDHVWISKDLVPKVKKLNIYSITREWDRPSDHVPIVIEINI